MRTTHLFLFMMLSGPLSHAAPEKDLSEYSEMSPEHCAELPPTKLYDRLIAADRHLPGISSLAGQDYFCSIYQRHLQKFVDAKYPCAREYRKPFADSLLTMAHYIVVVNLLDVVSHRQ